MQQAAAPPVRRERREEGAFRLPVGILPQPDEMTCGPTCLHAVFRYWGNEEPLDAIIGRSRRLEHGGTFAVFLACDALRMGYSATIYTYNITVFDPTWFAGEVDIAERLERQRRLKNDPRLRHATDGYLDFLELGGELRFVDLNAALLHGILRRRMPIITDPYQPTPYGPSLAYWVAADRLIASILLGIVTHDANLLVIHPRELRAPEGSADAVRSEPL